MSEVIDLSDRRRSYTGVLWWLAGWSAVIVVHSLVVEIQSKIPFSYAFGTNVIDFVPLALLSIAVWRVSLRLAGSSLRPPARLAVHIVLAIATVALWKGTYAALLYELAGRQVFAFAFASTWMYQTTQAVFAYGSMIGIMLAVQSSRRERERERREAQLELTAREAELAAVKAQLQPHFILNSLNSVLALVTEDPARAREMIIGLAELLQASFGGMDFEVVPLEREIELGRRYLEIEQIRFADRLRVSVVCDDDARSAMVPPLLLQPLIENAVKHGIGPNKAPGEVRVSAHRNGDRIRIEVHDSGAGADDDSLRSGGRGLELTRRRLDTFYRGEGRLTFERGDGFTVHLDLPAGASDA